MVAKVPSLERTRRGDGAQQLWTRTLQVNVEGECSADRSSLPLILAHGQLAKIRSKLLVSSSSDRRSPVGDYLIELGELFGRPRAGVVAPALDSLQASEHLRLEVRDDLAVEVPDDSANLTFLEALYPDCLPDRL